MGLNQVEQEIIFLKAVNEIIDSIVNFEVLAPIRNDAHSEIRFASMIHQRFFNIVLVDFLSCTDKRAPVSTNSFLGALTAVCGSPSFEFAGSAEALSQATAEFIAWLNQKASVDIWLPSINTEGKIQILRLDFLKMCGDISKHNFLRSVSVAEKFRGILAASGVKSDLDDATIALSNFYERFHTDIFAYHVSTIAEFLNNVRWGIHDYLQPELLRSSVWKAGDPPKRTYRYPDSVTHKLAQQCYWDLMNEVTREPCITRFRVGQHLKQRY
jgi:hypothetical protein